MRALLVGSMVGSIVGVAAAQNAPVRSGFTITISLVDFFMIQRALMLLPDEHAKETLASVRKQVSDQTKGAPKP